MRKVEAKIQQEVIKYCRASKHFKLAFHIENEGKETIGEAMFAKRMGRLAGLPDICIPLIGGKVLWLELKTTSGRVSKTQEVLHGKLIDMGHYVVVAKGLQESFDCLKKLEVHLDTV